MQLHNAPVVFYMGGRLILGITIISLACGILSLGLTKFQAPSTAYWKPALLQQMQHLERGAGRTGGQGVSLSILWTDTLWLSEHLGVFTLQAEAEWVW